MLQITWKKKKLSGWFWQVTFLWLVYFFISCGTSMSNMTKCSAYVSMLFPKTSSVLHVLHACVYILDQSVKTPDNNQHELWQISLQWSKLQGRLFKQSLLLTRRLQFKTMTWPPNLVITAWSALLFPPDQDFWHFFDTFVIEGRSLSDFWN